MQCKIVESIAYGDNNRIAISAMTQYGKSLSVSIGIIYFILMRKNKKVLCISPTIKQSRIIMDYVAGFLLSNSVTLNMIDLEYTGADRLKKEVSKSRITFKNGCTIMILSAEGKAERLMGFGADLVVEDESCLISHEVYRVRISRMLGANQNSIHVQIGNPFHRDNHFYQHWSDPRFGYKTIHISYKTAINEGRITEEFIEAQRRELLPHEFTILYDAEFPEEAENALFRREWIEKATRDPVVLEDKIIYVGVDVARFGTDYTVFTILEHNPRVCEGGEFYINKIIATAKEDTMQTVGRVQELCVDLNPVSISIDDIGVGGGVTDRLKEMKSEGLIQSKIIPCVFSARAELDKKHQLRNLKSEVYRDLRNVFEQGRIVMPPVDDRYHITLKNELMSMKTEYTSGRMKIIDPEKSPDFADSLAIALYASRKNEKIYWGVA